MMGKNGTINRFSSKTGSENCIPSLFSLVCSKVFHPLPDEPFTGTFRSMNEKTIL
jgi:hypothetical protein